VSELPLEDLPAAVAAAARRAAAGEVVYLTEPDGPLAAIVPAEIAVELESLGPAAWRELVEELADAQAARQALAEGGEPVPWQEVKAEAGLA
jgi:antitoxin (DNA-binding transcriptional repressor) of toxin-antitoxin stability system